MRYAFILLLLAVQLLLTPLTVTTAYDGEYTEYTELDTRSRLTEVSRGGSTGTYALVTGYTCGYESTGKSPGDSDFCLTASGRKLTNDDNFKYAAADTRYYPFGTKLYFEGIGVVIVADTGGDIKGPSRFDIFMSETNAEIAYAWGSRRVRVWVIN